MEDKLQNIIKDLDRICNICVIIEKQTRKNLLTKKNLSAKLVTINTLGLLNQQVIRDIIKTVKDEQNKETSA